MVVGHQNAAIRNEVIKTKEEQEKREGGKPFEVYVACDFPEALVRLQGCLFALHSPRTHSLTPSLPRCFTAFLTTAEDEYSKKKYYAIRCVTNTDYNFISKYLYFEEVKKIGYNARESEVVVEEKKASDGSGVSAAVVCLVDMKVKRVVALKFALQTRTSQAVKYFRV